MRVHLQFRRYRLPFRTPVRTAHGPWSVREGLIVRIADEHGVAGFGEAAPVPGFGTESVDEDEAACRALGEWTSKETIAAVPRRLGCLRNALAAACHECGRERQRAEGSPLAGARSHGSVYVGIAALLPAGRAALEQVGPKADIGFRVFKWKVGVGELADELAMLDDLCARLPDGAKLRLDANGAWDRRQAERWLERCADRPIEFVEQPAFAEPTAGEARQAKVEDLLLGLARDFPTPIALDESLVNEGDIERWIGRGWPGVYVVKPSLIGDIAGATAALEKARADVVFSSALETAAGAKTALHIAFAWNAEADSTNSPQADSTSSPQAKRALGFGVWPLFQDARFDGPHAAPFIRARDVEALNPEAVWNALN